MSAITDEYNSERIMIETMALQTDLIALNAAGGIVHYSKQTQTSAGTIDRIVVQAMPRVQETGGYNPQHVALYKVPVQVVLYMASNSTANFDTYCAAILAANYGTCPAAIVTLASSLFGARGFDWWDTEDIAREDSGNIRTFSKTWNAIFGP